MSKESNSSSGMGLTGVIFIVFLVLKLTGHIDWSWWWVTSPLWISVAIFLFVVVIVELIKVIFK